MDTQYNQVKDFHAAFGHPVATQPTLMPTARALKRTEWMQEELDEFMSAGTIHDQADAMVDLIYFALGTLVEIGVPPERIFEIVQRANMAKLHADGKPRHREDGKIIKPIGWVAPEPAIEAYVKSLSDEANRPPDAVVPAPVTSGLTVDATDPRLRATKPSGQHEVYLVLSEEERAKGFVRPVRRAYKHTRGCGNVTTMGLALCETYARDPSFYGRTFCCNCGTHLPVAQFDWIEKDGSTGPVLGS